MLLKSMPHGHKPGYAYLGKRWVPYKSKEYRDWQKANREKRVSRGRCHCGKWAKAGCRKCQACIDYANKRKRKHQDNWCLNCLRFHAHPCA